MQNSLERHAGDVVEKRLFLAWNGQWAKLRGFRGALCHWTLENRAGERAQLVRCLLYNHGDLSSSSSIDMVANVYNLSAREADIRQALKLSGQSDWPNMRAPNPSKILDIKSNVDGSWRTPELISGLQTYALRYTVHTCIGVPSTWACTYPPTHEHTHTLAHTYTTDT